jgi:hypothetical protein
MPVEISPQSSRYPRPTDAPFRKVRWAIVGMLVRVAKLCTDWAEKLAR